MGDPSFAAMPCMHQHGIRSCIPLYSIRNKAGSSCLWLQDPLSLLVFLGAPKEQAPCNPCTSYSAILGVLANLLHGHVDRFCDQGSLLLLLSKLGSQVATAMTEGRAHL